MDRLGHVKRYHPPTSTHFSYPVNPCAFSAKVHSFIAAAASTVVCCELMSSPSATSCSPMYKAMADLVATADDRKVVSLLRGYPHGAYESQH